MIIYLKNKHSLKIGDFLFDCCVGKSGISYKKIEGDKKTPKVFMILETYTLEKIKLKNFSQNLNVKKLKKIWVGVMMF